MNSMASLYFLNTLVGELHNVFESDGVWFGQMKTKPAFQSDGAANDRLLCYIHFAEDWNERVRNGERASTEEFDSFRDVLDPGKWRVTGLGFESVGLAEAPVFFRGGDLSWRLE